VEKAGFSSHSDKMAALQGEKNLPAKQVAHTGEG